MAEGFQLQLRLDTGPVMVKRYVCTPADQRFRQRVKRERGMVCECCGFAAEQDADLSIHHILEARIYPQHAREPLNVLVACQACHSAITSHEQSAPKARLAWYAGLSPAIRQPRVAFLKHAAPTSQHLHSAFQDGNAQYWEAQAFRESLR